MITIDLENIFQQLIGKRNRVLHIDYEKLFNISDDYYEIFFKYEIKNFTK